MQFSFCDADNTIVSIFEAHYVYGKEAGGKICMLNVTQ